MCLGGRRPSPLSETCLRTPQSSKKRDTDSETIKYRLDVGGNACALGSAYKAVWTVERKPGETFEDFISSRWRKSEFVEKIADGYQEKIYRSYQKGVDGLEAVEKDVLKKQAIDVGKIGTTDVLQE